MDITVYPRLLNGAIQSIPSKSQAHRLLICGALSDRPFHLYCPSVNDDIEATADCLNALGAHIESVEGGYWVEPIGQLPKSASLYCRESGSTLRFLLPVVAALGVEATFFMEGRLPERPLSALWEVLQNMGAVLSRPTKNTILCTEKLHSGHYIIDGSVSSQFITGLLFALSIVGDSKLTVTGQLESKPYIDITENALSLFGVSTAGYEFPPKVSFHTPGDITVEGDWSNSAFWYGANQLGSSIHIHGLNNDSKQGDCAICRLAPALNQNISIDCRDIPDLVPILAVIAGAKKGAVFHHIGRLRLKESDRVDAVCRMLRALGAKVTATEDTLTVFPASYQSCTIDAVGDHRIAMAAAIAATVASGPVRILGAHCVRKSYPKFWEDYQLLGGLYE